MKRGAGPLVELHNVTNYEGALKVLYTSPLSLV